MKTPERSRTSCVSQIVQSFCAKVLFCYGQDTHKFIMWCHVTSWHHTVTSPDVMTSYCDVTCSHTKGHNDLTWNFPSGKSLEITLSDLFTLTFDLRPWPTIPAKLRSRSNFIPKIKVIGPTVWPWEVNHSLGYQWYLTFHNYLHAIH